MTTPLKIDFVSDVSCPWCIIGLRAIEEALKRVGDEVQADIRFHPFELNPHMPAEGQSLVEHVAQKYGSTPQQFRERREAIRARAAELGFTIALSPDQGRVYNTFDAHRLLHWAGLEGRQHALKQALFDAYFTQCLNPGDHAVLVQAAEGAGLDRDAAMAGAGDRSLRRRGAIGRTFMAGARHPRRARRDHQRSLPDFRRAAGGGL